MEQTIQVVPVFTLGDRLRKAREHSGLTQSELAAELAIGRRSISRYEDGDQEPKHAIVIAWAVVCGVPVEWLTGGYSATDGTASDGEPHDRWSFAVAA